MKRRDLQRAIRRARTKRLLQNAANIASIIGAIIAVATFIRSLLS